MSDAADSREMTCAELVELVTDYLEGALPDAERARFEQHLRACPWCAGYLEQMRLTQRSLRGLVAGGLPAALRDELLAAFRDWRSG